MLSQAAVLALLEEAPSHGYMLGARLGELLGDRAPSRRQSIYDVLNVLSAERLIEGETDPTIEHERRQRLRYTVTDAGRRQMAEWVRYGFSSAPETREEFLVRMRCAAVLDDLMGIERTIARRIEMLLAEQEKLPPTRRDLPREPRLLVRRLLERGAEVELEKDLEWLEWAQAMVVAAAGDAARTRK